MPTLVLGFGSLNGAKSESLGQRPWEQAHTHVSDIWPVAPYSVARGSSVLWGVISYCFRANRELTLPRLQQHLARGESLPIKEPRGLWP